MQTAVNAIWSNVAVLAVLEQYTGSKYFVENNEKEDSTYWTLGTC